MPLPESKVKPTKQKSYFLFASSKNEVVGNIDGGHIRRLDFIRLAQRISQQLSAGSSSDSQEWLVAVKSPIHFAASVLACWLQEKTPVISADLQQETLKELAPFLAGVLVDESIDCCDLQQVNPVLEPSFRCGETSGNEVSLSLEFEADRIAVVLFTSGSTGKKKRLEKPFFTLFEEASNLEREFGARLLGTARRSTVSHFHIYGFLFNIFWPLHTGQTLSTETTFYWEQVLHNGSAGACIVSSPAHLRFLCSLQDKTDFGWESSTIFSSGGPLDRAVAVEIEAQTGICPIEVFGSTETGGIAWRCQNAHKEVAFTPFTGVELQQNSSGGLMVRSRWTGEGSNWMETGDLATITDEKQFFLRGRYDSVVKIAGKRVSINEMEQWLLQEDIVDAVRVFQVESDSQQSRSSLAAVIATGALKSVPRGTEKAAVVKGLKEHLRKRFDLVTLPRLWRFVAEMPTNSQGKTTLQMLGEVVKNVG